MQKNTDDCINMAQIDANGIEEEIAGWVACLEDIFNDVKHVEFCGEKIQFINFVDINEYVVVAQCKKGNKKFKVTPDSINFIKPTNTQKVWHKALVDCFSS